ncbi:MAG: DUF177 domain-containing protein [Bacteroidaceae bacterium]|nr:DUF177 domain-containing protein [Bacteroidaceae bacterium]
MGKFDKYSIQLKTMEIGTSEVEYHLGNEFFEAIDEEAIQKGNITAKVRIVKSTKQSELNFELEGKVVVLCDRCLEEMDQPIKTNGHLIVRMGKEYKDDGDDVVIVPEEQGIINVAWFLYEFIELAIPIKHVHPFGQCNSGMASKLGEHLVDSDSFEDDAESFIDSDVDDNESNSADAPIDPRWEALKKLKKD